MASLRRRAEAAKREIRRSTVDEPGPKKAGKRRVEEEVLVRSTRTEGPLTIEAERAPAAAAQAAGRARASEDEAAGFAAAVAAEGAAIGRMFSSAAASSRAGRQRVFVAAGAEGPVSVGPAKKQEEKQAGAAPAFIPAKRFAGAKTGYAFKKGGQGLGYYLEGAAAAPSAEPKGQPRPPLGSKRPAEQEAAGTEPRRGGVGQGDDEDEEDGSEDGVMTQRDLIRQAFAGDDVEAEFARDKAEEIEGELPTTELPGVLPGWGTWSGQQREPKWAREAREKAAR